MKAAIYTRFSTDLQQSTEMQVEKCRQYAADNNLEVVALYTDEGTTGTNTSRGGFQDLMFAANNKEFDAIIVYDITRGSRDVADWFNFRKLMNVLGIQVISTTENLGNILNPSDFLMELIQVGLGQHQVLSTRIKSIDGKTTKAREGLFQGGFAPLGYDIVDQKYVINETEAAAVRRIFSLYAEGYSYGQILDEIHKQGLKGKRGKDIGKNSLYSILGNDRYIGHYSWNRNINREMHKWVGKKDNPNCVELSDAIPPIIDPETWAKVQQRKGDKKNNAKFKAKEKYMLSGKIKCGKCGATYVGHTTTNTRGVKTRSYICGNKYRTKMCDAKNYNADILEIEIIDRIKQWLLGIDIEKFADRIIDTYYASHKIDSRQLKQELNAIENKIQNATLTYMENRTLVSFRDAAIDLQKRKNEIIDLLNSADAPTYIDRSTLISALEFDRANFDELSAEALISRYIKEINATGNEISVIGGVFTIGSSGMLALVCNLFEFLYNKSAQNGTAK